MKPTDETTIVELEAKKEKLEALPWVLEAEKRIRNYWEEVRRPEQ